MKPYALIDLHCDTLTACKYTSGTETDTLDDPERVLQLSNLPQGVHWAQFYAIFVPDNLRGADAIQYYEANRANFQRQMKKFSDRVQHCWNVSDMERAFQENKTAAFLSVENGSALAGNLDRVKILADDGVKALTLTWNGENEIGSGHQSEHGLSAFGKQVIPLLEQHHILADISHLNDAGVSDVLEIAQKPFVATHSNARAVTGHKRNLTDSMIVEMVRRSCLIGLNYYVAFLKEDKQVDSLDDLYRHIDHFLELGAAHCLALGSDFDGADLPACLNTPEKAAGIYEYLLSRNVPQEVADGILYQNVQRFFHKNGL